MLAGSINYTAPLRLNCTHPRLPCPAQVKQWGDGNVMVVVGSAQGGVSRMRFGVPLAPGSALDQIQACSLIGNAGVWQSERNSVCDNVSM